MRTFVHQQTLALLRRFALNVTRAARSGSPDTVHDLRVSIRRLSRCLRVFSKFYAGGEAKKLRRRIRKLMNACARVRDRDVAMTVLATAGYSANSAVMRRLRRDRANAAARLLALLAAWKQRGAAQKRRVELGI